MRILNELGEGRQVAFQAPMPGLYRFTALGASTTQFWVTQGGVADLVNGEGIRVFVVHLAAGEQLFHAGDGCTLLGARENDEIPEE